LVTHAPGEAPESPGILFIANNFDIVSGSVVRSSRTDAVTDLTEEGIGGRLDPANPGR